MAVVTTVLAVIGGVSFLGSVGYSIYSSEKEKKELRLEEIDNDIKTYNALISVFEDLKSKLYKSIEYFETGKTDFKNGGHVFQGVPLANTEFNDSINKLNSSITTINQLINAYKKEIEKLKQEKRSLQ